MAKRKRNDSKPSNAYLISFGDTMTAMLAFFIVLNTLAKEQTGANLHSGTGSFVAAVRGLGLPGWHQTETSKMSTQMNDASPAYYSNTDPNAELDGTGPDKEDNGLRSIDRQAEQVMRMLNEIQQMHPLDEKTYQSNQVTFDLFSYVNDDELPRDLLKVLGKSIPLVYRGNYEISLVVWSTSPAPSAVERATLQSSKLRQRVIEKHSVSAPFHEKIAGVSRLWISSTDKRPTVSVVITNVQRKD